MVTLADVLFLLLVVKALRTEARSFYWQHLEWIGRGRICVQHCIFCPCMTNASSTISCLSATSFTAQPRELPIVFLGCRNVFLLVSDARKKNFY